MKHLHLGKETQTIIYIYILAEVPDVAWGRETQRGSNNGTVMTISTQIEFLCNQWSSGWQGLEYAVFIEER